MATEVGQLILKVDTSEVKAAEAAVNRLGQESETTSKKTDGMRRQIDRSGAETRKYTQTIDNAGDEIRETGVITQEATQRNRHYADSVRDVSAATSTIPTSTKAANDALGGVGRKAAMAGIQIEQFAGQVAMGQNPLRALGVQAADLGFVLGTPLLGAVVGIGAAIGSVLIPMLLDAGDSTEELTDKMDELGLKFREMTQAQQTVFLLEFNKNLRELQDESEKARQRIEEIDETVRKAAAGEVEFAPDLDYMNKERARQQAIIDNNTLAIQRMTEALADETEAERQLRREREQSQDVIQRLYDRQKEANERIAAQRQRDIENAARHTEAIIATGDTETEAIQRREAEQLAIINDYRARDLISAQQHEEAMLQILANGHQARADLEIQAAEERAEREAELAAKHQENNMLMTDIIRQEDQKKKDSAMQTTTQLLALEDTLLKGKSEKQKAGFRLAVNLANAEKRENAKNIISNSYDAAMKAYKALAGIPIVGPALGAAAAGAILAAGVSYAAQSMAGRALGGQVRAGESYVVGERGPEVLTMGTGGRITPNEALKGGGQQVVNKTANVSFNIQANDTQGFDELLSARRGQIIAIINQAMNDQGKAALV